MRPALLAILVPLLTPPAGDALAAEPWIGRWAADPSGCKVAGDTARTSPLTVTGTSLVWFAHSCRIGKMYKIGSDAHIEAHCWTSGRNGTTPISLKPRGDRMAVIWDNAPAEEMRRCK